jgi:hypothetical protein
MGEDQHGMRLPWMPQVEETSGKPKWDQDEAEWLLGKSIVIGFTYLASDEKTVTSQHQFHGRITKAHSSVGLTIECEGVSAGKTIVLPPDLSAFRLASKGEYRLRSTGEVITDPDMLTTWTVVQRPKS